MTDTLNRKVCEKLGIEWHEEDTEYLYNTGIPKCSTCRNEFVTKNDLDEHIKESNPDFTVNAKDLIEMIDKREDRILLYCSIGCWPTLDGKVLIPHDYVTNPLLLCERFLEWEEKWLNF
jgi:hypothetical protein